MSRTEAGPYSVPERDPNPPVADAGYPHSGLRSEGELEALANIVMRQVEEQWNAACFPVLTLDYQTGTFGISFGPHMDAGIVGDLLRKVGQR